MRNWISKHKQLLMILAVALLLRFIFLLFSTPWSNGSFDRLVIEDGREYYNLAMSILNDHSFDSNLVRTPGQPILIALLFYVFGNHLANVFIFQIILSVVSILVIYYLIIELLIPFFKPEELASFFSV